jgi:mono/diheme cytochrome c family protein
MRLLAFIGALGLIGAIVAAGYFFGGFYSVAGTAEEPDIVKSVLIRVRTASIARHAKDPAPANLEDPATIQAGARQFVGQGCTTCHGGPGANWAKFSEGLHPDPPDLKEVVGDLTPSELFWAVKNGINMTGMPSFALAGAKDDELWQIVAFLKRLPNVSEADFKAWTAGVTKP